MDIESQWDRRERSGTHFKQGRKARRMAMPPSLVQALREIRQQRNPGEMIQATGAHERQLSDQSDPTRPQTSTIDYGGGTGQPRSPVPGPQALAQSRSRTIGAGRHWSPEEDPICPHPGPLTEFAGCLKVVSLPSKSRSGKLPPGAYPIWAWVIRALTEASAAPLAGWNLLSGRDAQKLSEQTADRLLQSDSPALVNGFDLPPEQLASRKPAHVEHRSPCLKAFDLPPESRF